MAYTPYTQYVPYDPYEWEARLGVGLNKFTDQTTGQVLELQSTPDSVSQAGTPFSADRMNYIEQGVSAVSNTSAYLLRTQPTTYQKLMTGRFI